MGEICSLPSGPVSGLAGPEHCTSLLHCPDRDRALTLHTSSLTAQTYQAQNQICQASARLRHHAKQSLTRNSVTAFSQSIEERNQRKMLFLPLSSKIFSGKKTLRAQPCNVLSNIGPEPLCSDKSPKCLFKGPKIG